MAIKVSLGLRNALLSNGGVKENLDAGFLYVFAGPVPADADAALDMATSHTEVAKITVNDDGTTGLTFDAPVNAVLNKAAAETWEGTINLDGFDAGPTVTPSFFRFVSAADNGRGAGGTTAKRIQGTAGGPSSGADLDVGSDTVTDNGTNSILVGTARFSIPAG